MDIKDHPCADGLTEECFRKYPKWARQMFAYRLLLTLCPHEITKRLPELKGLFPLLVPPDWPPAEVWTPGISIDPGVVFPEGWTPDDPLPAGVTISPGAVFPEGWTSDDPLPAGVTISPGAVFPEGWTSGDPLPAGVTIGRRQRPAVLGSGAIPPYYIQIWEPGPAHRPADTLIEEEGPVDIEGSVADGWIFAFNANWATVRAPGAASQVNDSDTEHDYNLSCDQYVGVYYIYRTFLYFDLSSIPSGKTVTEAILSVRSTGWNNGKICVQKGTQADTLVLSDWTAFEGVSFSEVDFTLLTPYYGPALFNFNAAGKTYLESVLGGTGKLCLRNYDYDFLNVAPTTTHYNGSHFANDPTAAKRPMITITYE